MGCCDEHIDTGPKRIFDSRKASELYDDYAEYRSESFFVPPGYVGVVEIIAPEEYMQDVTFYGVRLPVDPKGKDAECFEDCHIGKKYRRWKCQQGLGTNESLNGQPSNFTAYNSTIVYWGFDPFSEEVVEFEYITRPGWYYIAASRCENDRLLDCDNPTIFEMSLIKTCEITDLALPCNINLMNCCT